jgi:hypothetical protein
LVALIFTREARSPDERRLREALSVSIDRNQLSRVLLQGGGEATGSILPNWMTGFSFLFATAADLPRARQLLFAARQSPQWTVGYDAGDATARVIAERIVLNARDAGITLQASSSGPGDVRVTRIPLASLDGRTALGRIAVSLGLASPKFSSTSPEALYAAENSMLQAKRVVPLLHLRAVTGMNTAVQNWTETGDGGWRMPEVWLMPGKQAAPTP